MNQLSTQRLLALGWLGNILPNDPKFVSDGHTLILKNRVKWKTLITVRPDSVGFGPDPKEVENLWNKYFIGVKLIKSTSQKEHQQFQIEFEGPHFKVNLDYYKYLLLTRHFGEFEVYGSGPDSPVVFYKNGEPVALMMPMHFPE